MTEGQLREQVIKRRKEWKRSSSGYVPDHTWHWLQEEGYVEDALGMDFDDQAVEFIVRRIDQMHARLQDGGSRHRTRHDEFNWDAIEETQGESSPRIGEYVRLRAKAISEALAAFADQRPDVVEFRQCALSGRLLSPEEAHAMTDGRGNMLGELRELELRKLGSILANDYYGWDQDGAIWYVLTGKAPRLHPIMIRGRGKLPAANGVVPFQHAVTLEVLPWVPAKEVERAYRNVQEQVLEEAPRETGARILEVAQFCWEQNRTSGLMPSWRAFFERWNKTYPTKRFSKWRAFREYFIRGRKAVIPNYKLPEIKSSAEKQQEMQTAQEHIVKAIQGYRDKGGDRFIEVTFE
jgi:hypothetical protein